MLTKTPSAPNKRADKEKILKSVVLAQRETAILHSAARLDFIPSFLFAMSAADSSKGSAPPVPPGSPPPQNKGLVLTQVPSPAMKDVFEPPDWADGDLAEGDLSPEPSAQEIKELEDWKQLNAVFKLGMETSRYSKTKREMIKLEAHLKGSEANPDNLDMDIINKEQERRDENQNVVGMKIYREVHKMPLDASHKSIARKQWLEILSDVIAGVGVHCAKANEMTFGLCNDTEDPELSSWKLLRRATCASRALKK